MTTPSSTDFTASTDYVCGWTATACCSALVGADPDVAQRAVNTAAEILYALSGRQFGVCNKVVRPCMKNCSSSSPLWTPWGDSGLRWTPVFLGGEWLNLSCGGGCQGSCSCKRICEVDLPGPVDSITEVKIDGAVVDPGAYRVDNHHLLVRTDGECWPICQNMGADPTEVGTFQVSYGRGRPLPSAGSDAFGLFACEIVKALVCDSSCKLPARVTNVVRQGVTYTILDPLDFIEKGKTGLYLVDAWLAAVNPKARSRRASFISPDMPGTRSTTS